MIVVKIQGGLGNQMFQYAAGLRLATRHNSELRMDLTSLLDRTPRNMTFRDFDLQIFGIEMEPATEEQLKRYTRLADPTSWTLLERVVYKLKQPPYYREDHPRFHPEVLRLPKGTYLEGYFQDERYFSDIAAKIRDRFRLAPNERTLPVATRILADAIRSSGSCCLHVRRGDYVTNPGASRVCGTCSISYYRSSLEELRRRGAGGKVYVFSDDVAWCRETFKDEQNVLVVTDEHAGPRASIHFWLMTLCDHFIIANSSFAWWAAWLGKRPGSIICRPTPWFWDPQFSDAEICPPSWIRMPRG